MKLRFLLMAAMLVLVLSLGSSSLLLGVEGTNQNNSAGVVRGNNALAFDLYGIVAKEPGNLFFSPYSVSAALAMTYAGARGETAKQMEQTLHFDLAGPNLNPGFAELQKKFNAPGKSYQLSVANALWGQKGTTFYPEFLGITKKYYDSGFRTVDYRQNTEQARQTINKWVEAKTNRKIVELIKPKILTNLTRLVLTNAIYFKGKWQSQFKPAQTQEASFYAANGSKAKVQLMYQLSKFKYTETDTLQFLELPYNGGEIAMDILLPKNQTDLTKLESSLQLADFETLSGKLAPKKVQVFLPRFKLEKELSLGGYLQGLGMKDAFDENRANFSGMSKVFLYISHVIHKAFVEVNEAGTEAAAATGVVMDTKSAMPDQPAVFRADHPFIFMIRDLRSGSILFIGRMANP